MLAPGIYDEDALSYATGLDCSGDKVLTVQSQREDADINVIVRRFGITGEIPVSQRIPLNVDIDEVLDYRSCVDAVRRAEASFACLPAEWRERFKNDPANMVAFVDDDANLEEAIKLGLVAARPKEETVVPPA